MERLRRVSPQQILPEFLRQWIAALYYSVRELLPHRSQRRRPGSTGRHRTWNVKQTSRQGAKKELPCKGEPHASGRRRHRGGLGSPVPREV